MNPLKPLSPMVAAIIRPTLSPLERTQHTILAALSSKPEGEVYGGTASPKKVARNRAANKAARKARRANR